MGDSVIDRDGYRANVGIIITNGKGNLLWAKRYGQRTWQFPQGGIKQSETAEEALFRELKEEIGLEQEDVEILGHTQGWLRYRLPKRFIRYRSRPLCIGQKQRWFLLQLVSDETRVRLDLSEHPEFDDWCWVGYWKPLDDIVFFKRRVYERALTELQSFIPKQYVTPERQKPRSRCLRGIRKMMQRRG